MQLWRSTHARKMLQVLTRRPQAQHCLLSTTACRYLNHYEVLGLEKNCSQADVKDAFVRLSKQWHPDKQSSGERESQHSKFVELNTAYSVLSKPQLRAQYDAQLRALERGYYKVYDNHTVYTGTPKYKTAYEEFFGARDGDQEQQEGGRSYYGVPWIKNKLSNSAVVSIVVVFMLVGMVVHFYVARLSREFYVRRAERRDRTIAASYREVRQRALGSDRRAQLLDFQHELSKHPDTQLVGGQAPQLVPSAQLDDDLDRDRNKKFLEELNKSGR